MYTHKMLVEAGLKNTAQLSQQADTLSANTKLFFDCSEPYPVTTVTDVAGGVRTLEDSTSHVTVQDGDNDGVNVGLSAWRVNGIISSVTAGVTTIFYAPNSGAVAGDEFFVSGVTVNSGPEIYGFHTVVSADAATVTTSFDSSSGSYSAGGSARFSAQPAIEGGDWEDPLGSDYVMLVCAKAVDGDTGDVNDTGHISMYVSIALDDGSVSQLKVQPYYAVFTINPITNATVQQVQTPYDAAYGIRTSGQDYMFAVVKRGDYMEHYADGVFRGSVNVAEWKAAQNGTAMADAWRTQSNKGNIIALSHTAYGLPVYCSQGDLDGGIACTVLGEQITGVYSTRAGDTKATNEEPQNYYGILYHFFPNGAPVKSEIENGMAWMKERWVNGDKFIYPGWMF